MVSSPAPPAKLVKLIRAVSVSRKAHYNKLHSWALQMEQALPEIYLEEQQGSRDHSLPYLDFIMEVE